MRAMILSGSRNPEGRTAQAVNAIAAGFREAGGEVDIVFLPELAIERCRQCDSDGWGCAGGKGAVPLRMIFRPWSIRSRHRMSPCS